MPKTEIPREAEGTSSSGSIATNPQNANIAAAEARSNAGRQIENNFLTPISIAEETLDQLQALFAAIEAAASANSRPEAAMRQVRELAKLGNYVAKDIAELTSYSLEVARSEHAPTLLKMLEVPA